MDQRTCKLVHGKPTVLADRCAALGLARASYHDVMYHKKYNMGLSRLVWIGSASRG